MYPNLSGQSKCIHPSLRLRLSHPLAICLLYFGQQLIRTQSLPESVAKMKWLGMQRNKSECKSLLHEKLSYSKLEGKKQGERKLPEETASRFCLQNNKGRTNRNSRNKVPGICLPLTGLQKLFFLSTLPVNLAETFLWAGVTQEQLNGLPSGVELGKPNAGSPP